MRLSKGDLLLFVGLVFPALSVFRNLFLPGSAVFGDAPYFYPEGLKELVAEPYAWTSRGQNFGGFQPSLWLYPLMLLYGGLHALFNIDNGLIVRILFYFPSVTLAFLTPLLLVRYLGYSPIVQFFTSLLYGLNTYFLLLIDGGQVGIALAYSLLPLAMLSLHKLFIFQKGFWTALIIFTTMAIVDPRFAVIAVVTVLIWGFLLGVTSRSIKTLEGFKSLLLCVLAAIGINAFWLIPLIRLNPTGTHPDILGPQLVSLLDSLLLFQPHWPLNEFGKIQPPPFYFVGIPLLIFGGLLLKRNRVVSIFALCFLFFAFLAKGASDPLREVYGWLISNLPFGIAFRDSTKFFAPLLLFGGILLGLTSEGLYRLRPRFGRIFVLGIYIYLLFLISPALSGQLRGVLAARGFPVEFNTIYERLASQEGFFRTLWFPERHPFTFHTENEPALDAKDLVEKRPFSSLNTGTFDHFNFFHSNQSIEWLELLGVRYLMFSGDFRKANLNDGERADWENLLGLVSSLPGVEKTDWGQGLPIYKLPNSKPRMFSTDKLIAVVGSDNIYEKLRQDDRNNKFALANQAFVFFEDGLLDPSMLEGVASSSAVLVFNEKDIQDLTMSFLQKYFVEVSRLLKPHEWTVRSSREYLKWKYELLINGITTQEFDYGKGIVFSTQKGEKLKFQLQAPVDTKYILAIRGMGNGESGVQFTFQNKKRLAANYKQGNFVWAIEEVESLKKGTYLLTLENPGGTQVVNTVALVPIENWNAAQGISHKFTQHFQTATIDTQNIENGIEKLSQLGNSREINYTQESPVRYKLSLPKERGWVVFSDSYNSNWGVVKGREVLPSLPFYSSLNGFYLRYSWSDAEIVFLGQQEVRWGIYFSAVSLLVLLTVLFSKLASKKRK